MGYIWQTLWDIFIRLCDKLGKSYGIYSAKSMGYLGEKLWEILWYILV